MGMYLSPPASKGLNHKLAPLVCEGLACNITVLCGSVTNVTPDWRDIYLHLESNGNDKLTSFVDIAAAFRKEEASCKLCLLEVASRDRVCNRRLPYAGHTAQLEKALLVFTIRPL
jgi:hypothetical protein